MYVLGLISGTSVDAIDAALVQFEEPGDARLRMNVLHFGEYAMPSAVRKQALALLPPGRGSVRAVCDLNFALGEAFAQAALQALANADIAPQEVGLIASHGQTVYHHVEGSRALSTLQLGHPAIIAERTGITVAGDFRPRDLAAGGQGAPLASYLDGLLFAHETETRALLNLGGIANLTILPGGRPVSEAFAFDTGPANGLLDAVVEKLSGGTQHYDEGGRWAAQGEVHQELLRYHLAHAYYRLPPPKSTGKEIFGPAYADEFLARAEVLSISPADVLATLTALTAQTIAAAMRDFSSGVDDLIASGGGVRNTTLMRMIADALPGVRLALTSDYGLPTDGKEAVLFALLGYQLAHNRPNTLPGCTGAAHPVVMGCLSPGKNFADLMRACLQDDPQETRRLVLA